MVEIRCPPDCPYLATAREHPPAVAVRQQRQDVGLLLTFMRDLNDRQSQLFFLIATAIAQYRPSDLASVVDDDVAEAAAALAGTFETAARGVIYEHRPSSVPAERLMASLKAALNEAAPGAGSPFERDAALILRRIEEAARRTREADATGPRALIGLLDRVVRHTKDAPAEPSPDAPRLIVP
jgi:hypothetical protein